MICEMCGKDKAPFFTANVEGVRMTLCSVCSKYGKDPKPYRAPQPLQLNGLTSAKAAAAAIANHPADEVEVLELITPDYARRIKDARERKHLKQEDLAKQLAEKESILHALESGKHQPSLTLARKLEKALRITLVERHEEKKAQGAKSKASGPLTIGDMLTK